MAERPLTGLAEDILRDLADDGGWVRPMDVGGTDASPHSRVLRGLCKRGLAERRRRWVGVSGGSNLYRITPAGKNALRRAKEPKP